MAVTSPPPMRTTHEPQWTPRQREVLDLLVGGFTNSQIAERLNISLDGAKWHVSEIITRLGVDTRDEAAEYWRHHNGLRMRFTRIASGFFTSGALKWGMATAVLAGVVAVSAMVIIALRETGGDEPEQGGGSQNPGLETPTTVASPAPTVVATAPPTTGEVINGINVQPLTFTQPGLFPVPMSAIIEKGCYQCDGPTSAIERVTLDATGNLRVEELFNPAAGYISSSNFDSTNGDYYLTVCSRGYCGGVGEISADAQTTVYRSADKGVTWTALETFDGDIAIAAITQQGPLLNHSRWSPGAGAEYQFQLLGSSTIIRPPSGTEPAYSNRSIVGWLKTGTREILNFDGTPLVTLPEVDSPNPPQIVAVLGDDMLIRWLGGPSPAERSYYVGVMKNGALESIFEAPSTSTILWDWLNPSVAFGNVTLAGENPLYPAMFDLANGQVQVLELFGPVGSDAYNGQRNYLRHVETGPFARVAGAGDCLNVREQPSTTAAVLGCYADNVLLKNLNESEQAGGITWWKIQTPAGKQGWASAEFLEGAQPQQ